jgi:hypothetical protein
VPNNKLPPEVVEHWPEIFKDIEIKAVPLNYLESVLVYFVDGKTWEIDLEPARLNSNNKLIEALESDLQEFFKEYDDSIKSVVFKLDTKRVISDVKQRTKSFMKKRM